MNHTASICTALMHWILWRELLAHLWDAPYLPKIRWPVRVGEVCCLPYSSSIARNWTVDTFSVYFMCFLQAATLKHSFVLSGRFWIAKAVNWSCDSVAAWKVSINFSNKMTIRWVYKPPTLVQIKTNSWLGANGSQPATKFCKNPAANFLLLMINF